MKNDRSDRRWILFIVVLLIIEISWLLIDFRIIEISLFSKKEKISEAREAGFVINVQEQLKRRGANSLVWESTNAKEILYFQDSILTLANSTARLNLKEQTELQLSENTLVTIEEPSGTDKSEIRLRFSKGDIKARNPSSRTQIQGDDWIVNLESGSEISLRKNKLAYEFEILDGKGSIETKNGVKKLGKSELLQLGNNHEIKSIAKIESLKWSDSAVARAYVSENKADVNLQWTGSATELLVQGTEKGAEQSETKHILTASQFKISLMLTAGSYKVRLISSEGISDAKAIEVLKVPQILLKSPLARDRFVVGETVNFLWIGDAEIKKYHFVMTKNGREIKNEFTTDTSKTIKFIEEGDYTWSISGHDMDGHKLPNLKKNSFYVREAPLKAPVLKEPVFIEELETEEKISPGASLKRRSIWSLLFPMAFAVTKPSRYEVTFEWTSVPGANAYTLEVSETSDFSSPLLVRTLKENKFTWKNAENRKYFWRVASGNSNGHLGFFSTPMLLQLTSLRKIIRPTILPTVPDPATKIIPTIPPTVVVAEPKPILTQDEIKIRDSAWGFAWTPAYKVSSVSGDQNSKIVLKGGAPLAFQINYKSKPTENGFYIFTAKYLNQTWRPDPPEKFPQQPSISLAETAIFLEKAKATELFRYGLAFRSGLLPQRMSNQVISVKQVSMVGLRASWQKDSLVNQDGRLYATGFNYSKEIQQINFDFEQKYYLSEPRKTIQYYIGGALNLTLQKDFQQGAQGSLHFLLGLSSF